MQRYGAAPSTGQEQGLFRFAKREAQVKERVLKVSQVVDSRAAAALTHPCPPTLSLTHLPTRSLTHPLTHSPVRSGSEFFPLVQPVYPFYNVMQLLLLLLLHFTVAAVCLAATALESVSALPLSSSYSSSAAFVSASLAGRPRPSSRALGNDDDEFDPIPAELDACRRYVCLPKIMRTACASVKQQHCLFVFSRRADPTLYQRHRRIVLPLLLSSSANPQESFVWCAAAILGGKATRAAVEQARTDPTTAPSPLAALSSEEAILLEEFAAELLRDQYSRIGTLAAAATAASTIKLSAALDPAPRPAPAVAMDQQSELTTDSVLRASGLDRFSEKVPSDAYSSRIEFGPAPTPTPIFASDSFHPSPLDTSFVADVAALYTPLPDSDGEHSPAPTSYTQGLMSAIARRVVEGGDSDTHSAMPTDPDLLGQVRKQLRGELMEQSIHVEPADEAPSRVGSVLDCFVSTALGGKLGEESNETSHFLPTTGLHRALMVAHGDVSMVTLHDRDFRQSNELRIQDITILFAPSMRRLVEEGARCSGMGGMLGTPSSGSEDPVVSGAKGDLILLTPHSVVLSIGIPPQSVRVSEPLSELDMPLTMEGAQFWLDHSVWLEQAVGDALPSLWPVAWEHADIEGSATPGPRVQPRGSDDEFSASHFFKGKRVDTNSRDMHRHLKSAVLLHMLGQLELLSGDASQAHMALSEACHIAVRFSNSLRNGGVARQQCFGSLAQALAALGRNDDAAEARSVSQRRKVSTRQMSEMLKRFSVRAALVNPLLSDSNFSVQSHHAVAVWSMIGSVMHAFNVHTAEDAVVLVVQWCLIGVTLHWWWTGSIPGFAIGWGPGKLEKSKSTTFRRRRTKSRGCCNERHSKAKKAQWRPSQVAKIGRCWIDDCKSFAERVCVSACERW